VPICEKYLVSLKKKTMKSPGLLIFMSACFIIFAGNLYAQVQSFVASQTLTYIESSSGLSNPEWEGGRTELEFADIDADGLLDIITIGDHGSPFINAEEHGIMVYFGDGAGNWSVQMTGDFGYGGIAAGDVNNDSFMDVGYAMHHNYSGTDFGDQLIEVALGNGTGINWTPWDDGLATNGEDYGMFATDFADVDNDGDLDLGSISFGCCAGIHVYLNNFNGSWTQSFGVLEGNSDMIFQFGDVNNDGFMDFVAGYENGTVYFGDGTGDFILKDLNLPPGGLVGRLGPSLGDVDNDGGMDLAFANNNGGLHVYIFDDWDQLWQDFSGDLPSTGPFEHTQLADMNMDGYIDLAAYGTGTFQLFLGDGNGTWTPDATFTTGDPGSSQAFRVGGDIDHNGRPDIVLLEEEELSWFTYQNYLRCYRESSVPVLLAIKPVFPCGHELLWQNSVRFIDWISTVPGNEAAEIKLEYSTTGPDGAWTLIAAELPNSGSHQWLVPQENSVDCYIRQTVITEVNSHSSITPAAFTITDGTIGVNEMKPEGMGISVYPNPAGRQLTVDSQQSAVKMVITDLFGRRIKECANISSFPFLLDISDLQPGMYILRAINKDGQSGSSKFQKVPE
jgi:hypothetical protein